jgi:GTP cyclohydrolase I
VVEHFARRAQVQERLTEQIAGCLDEGLQPLGVMVVIEARHLCLEMRGVRLPGTVTRTRAVRGVLRS